MFQLEVQRLFWLDPRLKEKQSKTVQKRSSGSTRNNRVEVQGHKSKNKKLQEQNYDY